MTGTGSCHTHSYTPHYGNEAPFEVPESWEWCTIDDIAESNIGLTYKPSDISNDGVPVYRSNNIQNRSICLDDVVRVDTQILEKQYLHESDLLICARNGSRNLVGKCALIPSLSEPTTFGAFMAVCRSSYNKWIFLLLNSDYFDAYLDDSNSTAINQVTQKMLLAFQMPFPPANEQDRIYNEVCKWFSVIDSLEIEERDLNLSIEKAKFKILELAIHGKLVPQDPNDEPAIELLKRINPSFVPCDNGHYENIPEGWTVCTLEEIIDYEQPQAYIVQSTDYKSQYKIPVLTAGKSFIIGYTNETEGVFTDLPVIIFDDFTTDSKFVDFPFKVKSSAMKILHVKDGINIQYVCQFMSITRLIGDTHKRYWISEYSKLPIPIPPSAEQSRIINKINELLQILDNISAEL